MEKEEQFLDNKMYKDWEENEEAWTASQLQDAQNIINDLRRQQTNETQMKFAVEEQIKMLHVALDAQHSQSAAASAASTSDATLHAHQTPQLQQTFQLQSVSLQKQMAAQWEVRLLHQQQDAQNKLQKEREQMISTMKSEIEAVRQLQNNAQGHDLTTQGLEASADAAMQHEMHAARLEQQRQQIECNWTFQDQEAHLRELRKQIDERKDLSMLTANESGQKISAHSVDLLDIQSRTVSMPTRTSTVTAAKVEPLSNHTVWTRDIDPGMMVTNIGEVLKPRRLQPVTAPGAPDDDDPDKKAKEEQERRKKEEDERLKKEAEERRKKEKKEKKGKELRKQTDWDKKEPKEPPKEE